MFNQALKALEGSIPVQGTAVAVRWDGLYGFLVWLSVFFFALIVGAMIYFVVTYKHKANQKTSYITGSHLLEAIWIAVPTILLLGIFAWGYSIYHSMVQAPADAYEVRVIGKQWMWTFQYDDGRTTVGELYVPVNRPIKLVMTSEDVLHSFFIPSFRVKQDVVPGMYSSLWFSATIPGKHQVFCTEYCGTSHSEMLAKLIVLNDDQWKAWKLNRSIGTVADVQVYGDVGASASKAGGAQLSLAEQGREVYEKKGCVACHSTDGTIKVGPSFKGVYGSKIELTDGRFVTADENFIRNHIENPAANTVKGFNPVMPSFKGLITEAEMNALIAFIKSLK